MPKPDEQKLEKIETRVEAETDGLLRMSKAGEVLHIHPMTLDQHIKQGWNLA